MPYLSPHLGYYNFPSSYRGIVLLNASDYQGREVGIIGKGYGNGAERGLFIRKFEF
jgi:hypothetical protein